MRSLRISKSYAKALLKTAESQGRTETVYRDIQYLEQLVDESAEFELFLSPYFFTDIDRPELLFILFGNQLDPLTFEFVELLDKRRDLMLLPPISKAFKAFYCHLRGIVQANIRTAAPLSPAGTQAFVDKTRSLFGPQTDIHIAEDPSLLGGFVMETSEHIYDCSLSGQLDRLKRRMMGAV